MLGTRPTTAPGGARLWAAGLAGALLAAAGAWQACGSKSLTVEPAIDRYNMMGVWIDGPTYATRMAAERQTAARVYGAFGALLGAALGLAGGLAAGRARGAAAGAVVGLVAGGAAGFAPPLVVLPVYVRLSGDSMGELVPALLMHGALWALIGAAGGLALGVGLGGWPRVVRGAAGGAIGALVGAAVYEFAGAGLMPMAETGLPVAATSPARLLAFLCVGLAGAAFALLLAAPARPAVLPVPVTAAPPTDV